MNWIAKGSEESISRKVSIQGNQVHLINHTVKRDNQAQTIAIFDKITIEYPDGENVPSYILEKAAKTDWIVVQDRMRKKLKDTDWEQIEGLVINAKDINGSLGVEGRGKVDPVLSAANKVKNLTPEQRAELMAMLQAGN